MEPRIKKSSICYQIILFAVLLCQARSQKGLCWTKWINKYRSSEGLDDEILSSSDAYVHGVCSKPLALDVARVDGLSIREKLNCEFYGCVCRNTNQLPGVKCGDYKVKFLCPCKGKLPDITGLVCNKGTSRNFKCSKFGLIETVSAYYGNIWLSQCGLGQPTSTCRQQSSKTLEIVKKLCDGKSSCTLPAPPAGYGGPKCGTASSHLHVQMKCHAQDICIANNTAYKPGEQFTDPACRFKCYCLKGSHSICTPICPIYHGFACPVGSVVRWGMKSDRDVTRCKCLTPRCVSPSKRGCIIEDKKYQQGAIFHYNCREECRCLGNRSFSCMSLCPNFKKFSCTKDQVVIYETRKTKYPECKCTIPRCVPA